MVVLFASEWRRRSRLGGTRKGDTSLSLASHETSEGRCPPGMGKRVKGQERGYSSKGNLDKTPGTLGTFAWCIPVSHLLRHYQQDPKNLLPPPHVSHSSRGCGENGVPSQKPQCLIKKFEETQNPRGHVCGTFISLHPHTRFQ